MDSNGGSDVIMSLLVSDKSGESRGEVVVLSLGVPFTDRGNWIGYMGGLGDGHFRE